MKKRILAETFGITEVEQLAPEQHDLVDDCLEQIMSLISEDDPHLETRIEELLMQLIRDSESAEGEPESEVEA